MQKNNAKQTTVGTGRLRGRELGQITEDVLAQVGVHFHAGRGTGQVRLTKYCDMGWSQ